MMKKFYFVGFILMNLFSFSQVKEENIIDNENKNHQVETTVQESEGYEKDKTLFEAFEVDVKPDFRGGIEKFKLYISKKIKIPKEITANKKKGIVFIQFIIEKDGKISNIKALRDFGYGSKEEAERIMKKCPNWLPAEYKGEKVRCKYSFPIRMDGTI